MSKDTIQGNLVVYSQYRHPEHPDYNREHDQQQDEADLFNTCAALAAQHGIDLSLLIKLVQFYFDLENAEPPKAEDIATVVSQLLDIYVVKKNWRLAVAEFLGLPAESPKVVEITG
ncbi:MAG TPA: hypothetical protein VFX23_09765 [Limnobacter sp.]|nr:hypothetical protein [Limnobacter sp.]